MSNLIVVLIAAVVTVAAGIFFSQNFSIVTGISVWIGIFIGYWCRDIIAADQTEQRPHPQDADWIEGRPQG